MRKKIVLSILSLFILCYSASAQLYVNKYNNAGIGTLGNANSSLYIINEANNTNQQTNGLVNSISINSGSGESAGIRNIVTTHGSGGTFGIINTLKNSSGSGQRIGISNQLRTNTSIVEKPEPNYGIYNSITKYNNSDVAGESVALKIEKGAEKNAYGVLSQIWTPNAANVNTLNANNTLYAVKGEINTGLYGYAAHFTANNGYAGWFEGDVEVTGQLTFLALNNSNNNYKSSQKIQKTNADISKIYALKNKIDVNGKEKVIYTFDADNVQKIYPSLVKENEKTNTKGIDYVGFIPLLLNTINEQNEVVEKSKFEIEELNAKVNDLSEQLQQLTDKYNLMRTQLDEIVANPNKESSTLEPHDIKDDGMELHIYPNPADSQFTIQTATKSSGKIQVNIYNASGQNISSNKFYVFEGQNENTIQTKDWVAGNYYVNVSFNGHIITKNIILK